MKKGLLTLLLLSLFGMAVAKNYTLTSPNKEIVVTVSVQVETTYSVAYKGEEIISTSPLSMTFANGTEAGVKMKARGSVKSVSELITPTLPTKFDLIENQYNQLTLSAGAYDIVFRAFDDGVAYRFETRFKEPTIVESEQVVYSIAEDGMAYFGQEESLYSHQERVYITGPLSGFQTGDFASMPMVTTNSKGVRTLITEVDLESYAGMFIEVAEEKQLKGKFSPYALECEQTSDRDVKVTKYADYLAKVEGTRTYPWRVAIITDNDGDLITSTMVARLASPNRLEDTSWITPGKVAWDWWNANNIYGVDFEAGINTQTYKYFIDVASKYNLKYIILDEGWYDINKDILSVVPEIDMAELIAYGKQKCVDIILWGTWKALQDKEDEALAKFEEWGIKGIKIDFMQRDDQEMVDFYYRIAQKAADHKLLVDYHGCYKPTGLQHTYPNVISFEGVKGLENLKWSALPDPQHNLYLPFLRMVAGPMDYTPGGMTNLYREEYLINYERPSVLGTRAHQMALYVVFESPLQMLADNPSNLDREPLTMEFLSQVPVTWDETRVIEAELGEYIVIARRKGDKWYLGGMTNWTEREFKVSLNFLDEGGYKITSWEDGKNVKRQAQDHAKYIRQVDNGSSVTMKLASGGGYVAIIER
ncbi:MAG: glycoside hydrolase family 97 protein [Rikenellaceae bacterium]